MIRVTVYVCLLVGFFILLASGFDPILTGNDALNGLIGLGIGVVCVIAANLAAVIWETYR